ncbi:MAG: BREX-1 system adenine-specific DNA-methyltransferase PglX [Planctomycetales bacterium]|nr:BREX-1 system adenine-specific DNA-methyltransferase PglX [Planctomycetales bacterium]
MDQDTRNKLQRATQQVRRILEEEFAEQLEGTFDVLPNGKILPEPGKHLDARQRLTRQKLVDAIEHTKAGGKTPQEAVEEYTREAAFTFLNRFVALRMLEARGMLQECVSQGDASSGFKEFCGLAPGLSSLDDGGYRLYLECLFDELTVEVKVLFDRRDSASLLWPRRGALTELLDILGRADLADVWIEDETIGWVYQYFNSGEERKKMREESQVPRNSRELAVRNQFFTPRYVVEFLTDNTLGRIWYEMRKGDTRLVDECQFLVRRPGEVFLDGGQELTADESEAEHDLSQEELLKKTVYIPHRAMKDPREIRILDPACGSGHFLLYAFDLLISIYDEAWQDDASPTSEITGRQLREDYPGLEQLHAAMPGMVLAHNLHGIDIDPRAAQIAALALWMRGQRAFNDFGIARKQRLPIDRSNIVCAEPMPGEGAYLDEFINEHLSDGAEGRFLANLVRKVFEAMKLAGEAGSLLKIEEDIAEEVAKAKKQWLERPEFKQQTLFDDSPSAVQQKLDLTSGIVDEKFWEEAEQRIYDALRAYSEQAERSGGFQRRLFAADTARGFSFIDLCRGRYDVALMNPPFGDPSAGSLAVLKEVYPMGGKDLFRAFIERMPSFVNRSGLVGSVGPRPPLYLVHSEEWRKRLLLSDLPLYGLADLGIGVLDEALVEACAYLCTANKANQQAFFIRAIKTKTKEDTVRDAAASPERFVSHRLFFVQTLDLFRALPKSAFAYWVSNAVGRVFSSLPPAEDSLGNARVGLQTSDDFRFLRARWEIPAALQGIDWVPAAKGGEYSPFFSDIHLVVNWRMNGAEIKAFHIGNGYSSSKYVMSEDRYGSIGITWSPRTTTEFAPRVLPAGCIFGQKGPSILVKDEVEAANALAITNSRVFQYLLTIGAGAAEIARGSSSKSYGVGLIQSTPVPSQIDDEVGHGALKCFEFRRNIATESDVTCSYFTGFRSPDEKDSFRDWVSQILERQFLFEYHMLREWEKWDHLVTRNYGLPESVNEEVGLEVGTVSGGTIFLDSTGATEETAIDVANSEIDSFDTSAFGIIRRLAAIHSDELEGSKRHVIEYARNSEAAAYIVTSRFIDYLVGCSFGRFSGSADTQHRVSPFVAISDVSNAASNVRPSDKPSILVDDPSVNTDLMASLNYAWVAFWGQEDLSTQFEDLCSVLGITELRTWLAKKFFPEHTQRHSKSRRSAPIYWQLATPSASYSVWVYYHQLTRDTFFQVLDDYVKPKLSYERQKSDRLQAEAGAEPTRSQRKEIEDQEKFVAELAAMVEEVERIAPLWNPNLNDGVIINFSPLWRLVPQNKSWQKECKKVWDKLVKGNYDWAHLAMHLWPERVVPKCVADASLAIAHGLEDVFWEPDDRDRFQPKEEPQGGWDPIVKELVNKRTSPAVKAALESLLTAPAPAGNSKSRRRKATT